ncbi:hypothetical protein B0H16DRAFT_1500846 [Mycena metata]|uniref:RFX-type winged-helix domain-containing protein n=1 Tax=Mycena metata TaxID=1033252 RepID=A0AAD7K824_9AGAR|nr:hypothetical protein B0H16DRAFT_1500846 [Mycena metata]
MSPGNHPQLNHDSMLGVPQIMTPDRQEETHVVGAFGGITLSPDHALEKLAANVRAATTTSECEQAERIFAKAWLTARYTPDPERHVLFRELHISYRRVCRQYGIDTANLAKAIRLCFPTAKMRWLGNRYHYCGIGHARSQDIGTRNIVHSAHTRLYRPPA